MDYQNKMTYSITELQKNMININHEFKEIYFTQQIINFNLTNTLNINEFINALEDTLLNQLLLNCKLNQNSTQLLYEAKTCIISKQPIHNILDERKLLLQFSEKEKNEINRFKNLFRAMILTKNKHSFYLIITANHCIIDGWSLINLFKQTLNFYKNKKHNVSIQKQSNIYHGYLDKVKQLPPVFNINTSQLSQYFQCVKCNLNINDFGKYLKSKRRKNKASDKTIVLSLIINIVQKLFSETVCQIAVVNTNRHFYNSELINLVGLFWNYKLIPMNSNIIKNTEMLENQFHCNDLLTTYNQTQCISFNYVDFKESLSSMKDEGIDIDIIHNKDLFHFPLNISIKYFNSNKIEFTIDYDEKFFDIKQVKLLINQFKNCLKSY